MKPNTEQAKVPESKPELKDDLKSLPMPELGKNWDQGKMQNKKSLVENTRLNYTDGG